MRQYGEVPPVLSTAQAPMVQGANGLGSGGGASVFSKGTPSDGQGYGEIIVDTGSNPGVGGNITLLFMQVPPTLFFSGDQEFGALVITGQGTSSPAITWATTLPIRRRLRLQYEWAVSQ